MNVTAVCLFADTHTTCTWWGTKNLPGVMYAKVHHSQLSLQMVQPFSSTTQILLVSEEKSKHCLIDYHNSIVARIQRLGWSSWIMERYQLNTDRGKIGEPQPGTLPAIWDALCDQYFFHVCSYELEYLLYTRVYDYAMCTIDEWD